ncbi:MAG TPA: adenylate/guanylate cyclase domain-containing protein, partial [Anaerolineae bacterium]|nr:adenylate/guanylate cyclase domain-containing protein [Anaerolineae bacterium]
MMPKVVPEFILQQYVAGERSGEFGAVGLFVDVSGFTAVTNILMQHGNETAETLAIIMQSIFEPLIAAVYEQGGFITGFAGDAFTALFAGEVEEMGARALAAGVKIQTVLNEQGLRQTDYGSFAFAVKQGLAVGDVQWGILEPDDEGLPASYYFSGEAVDGCAEAEHQAKPGEIILTRAVADLLVDVIDYEPIGERFCRWERVVGVLPEVMPIESAEPAEMWLKFVDEGVAAKVTDGEFRQVVSLFLNLKDIHTTEQLTIFMQSVFRLQKRYGGYLNHIDFGDKGCNLLLFWGMPSSFENDLERALNFVLAIPTVTPGTFRAGVTYQRMYAGLIGSVQRQVYSCYGQGVNLAARMMTAAPWG